MNKVEAARLTEVNEIIKNVIYKRICMIRKNMVMSIILLWATRYRNE